jgi:hypothetical protein
MEFHHPDRSDESEEHLKALERRLAAWQPSSGALDRDRMLYEAGRAAARADSHIQAWRLATAALLIVTAGLSALAVHQASQRLHERSLLALELAQERRMQTSTAATPSGLPAESSRSQSAAAGSFAPASYFVLTTRLVAGDVEAPWRETEDARPSQRRDPGQPESGPASAPLRPRDLKRVLEL